MWRRSTPNYYIAEEAKRAEGADMSDALAQIQRMGRDNARMPVSWDDTENAGFTRGTPWIKINEDYRTWNVAGQEGAKGSVLSFWQDLLNLRREEKDLVYGRFEMVHWDSEDIYAYTRGEEQKFLVACSFCKNEVHRRCPVERGEVILATYEVGG